MKVCDICGVKLTVFNENHCTFETPILLGATYQLCPQRAKKVEKFIKFQRSRNKKVG